MEWVLDSMSRTECRSHLLTNVLIEVDGDRATSESCIYALRRMDGNDVVTFGHFSDAWSRRDGAWRIDERHYKRDALQTTPIERNAL